MSCVLSLTSLTGEGLAVRLLCHVCSLTFLTGEGLALRSLCAVSHTFDR